MDPNAIMVDQSAAVSVVPKSLSDEPEVEASPKYGGGCIDLFIGMFISTCQGSISLSALVPERGARSPLFHNTPDCGRHRAPRFLVMIRSIKYFTSPRSIKDFQKIQAERRR